VNSLFIYYVGSLSYGYFFKLRVVFFILRSFMTNGFHFTKLR